jgi:hypothetical protein
MGVVSTFAETATKGIKKAVTKGSKKALKTTAKQVVPEVASTGLSKSGKNFMANNFPEIDQIAYESLQPNSKSYNEINSLINRTAEGDQNANILLSDKLSNITLDNQKLAHAQQLNNKQFANVNKVVDEDEGLAKVQAKYPDRNIYRKPPSTPEGRAPFIKEHELEKAKPAAERKIPYFVGDDSKLYFLDTKKLNEYGPGDHRYAMRDLQSKLAQEAARRATELSKTIPLEDYIEELGEELGTKAFKFNKSRMKKLYRWVSEEGAHLDHIWPLVSTPNEGFHHINNLILLYSKHNLKKSNKVLPRSLFNDLGIPLTKRDLIRSTLEKPRVPNKVKRQKILEALGIIETQ